MLVHEGILKRFECLSNRDKVKTDRLLAKLLPVNRVDFDRMLPGQSLKRRNRINTRTHGDFETTSRNFNTLRARVGLSQRSFHGKKAWKPEPFGTLGKPVRMIHHHARQDTPLLQMGCDLGSL